MQTPLGVVLVHPLSTPVTNDREILILPIQDNANALAPTGRSLELPDPVNAMSARVIYDRALKRQRRRDKMLAKAAALLAGDSVSHDTSSATGTDVHDDTHGTDLSRSTVRTDISSNHQANIASQYGNGSVTGHRAVPATGQPSITIVYNSRPVMAGASSYTTWPEEARMGGIYFPLL